MVGDFFWFHGHSRSDIWWRFLQISCNYAIDGEKRIQNRFVLEATQVLTVYSVWFLWAYYFYNNMEKCALKKLGDAWLCSADSAVSVCFWCLALLFLALKMFSSVRWKLQRKHSIFRKREKNKEKMSNLCESIDSCCFEVFVVASFQVFLLSHQSVPG